MFFKVLLTITLLFISYGTVESYRYSIDFKDESVFSPCQRSDALFLDDFWERHLQWEFLSNGSVYVHGHVVFKWDPVTDILGQDDYAIDTFVKRRGAWVTTIYTMKRKDICIAAFNPGDLWFPYLSDITEENRKCPFFKGQIFPFNHTINFNIDLPNPNFEGEYLITQTIEFKSLNETCCFNIHADFYRE